MRRSTCLGALRARLLAPVTAIALAVAFVSSPALAAKTAMTEEQKEKVRKAINILEQGLKQAGVKDMKMKDVLGSGAGQMPYDKIKKDGMDVDPTFCDAIDHMKNMLDKDNIVVDPDLSGFGKVNVANGIDSDKIVIREGIIDKICDMTASATDRAKCKIQLIATLANELMHVYQDWLGGTDGQRCDGEHDSDCASIKILEALCKILEKDGMPGMPNDSLAGILGDADYFPGLIACLFDLGVDTAAEIKEVFDHVKARLGKEAPEAMKEMRSGYKGRKQNFGDKVAAGTSWRVWYGGGRDDPFAGVTNDDTVGRLGTTMGSSDLMTTQFYPLPPGFLLTASRAFQNDDLQVMLAMTASNGAGQRALWLFRDTTGDELPELSSQTFVPLPPVFPGMPDLYETQLLDRIPIELHPLNLTGGLHILDRFDGSFHVVPLNLDGGLGGPPQTLFQNPAIQSGGFQVFDGFIRPNLGVVRYMFHQINDGEPNTAWFDLLFPGPVVIPSIGPGQTIAMAKSPTTGPGIEVLAPAAAGESVELTGNPGEVIDLYAIGRALPLFLAEGIVASNGSTGPIPIPSEIDTNNLYMNFVLGGFGLSQDSSARGGGPGAPPVFHFLPRRGVNIDCRITDEDQPPDGNGDRVHLSVHPNRVHFLQSVDPGFPTFDHQMELVIDCGDLAGFVDWNSIDGRTIFGGDDMSSFSRMPLFSPPAYVQNPIDADGDGMANEAVLLVRFSGDTDFSAYTFTNIFAAPALIFSQLLPMGFEPDCIEYTDLNGDTMVDMRITDFDGGPDVCLLNTFPPPGPPVRAGSSALGGPGGGFIIGPCVAVPPCCPGNADKVTPGQVTFNDVLAVLANFLNPGANPNGTSVGDANCNGVIDFNDVLNVLANFLALCP